MPKPQKVLRDNVLTALGALGLDQDLRQQYFLELPAAPLIRQHNIPITDDETADLAKIVPPTGQEPSESDLKAVPVCPQRPCVYRTSAIETIIGAAVMDDTFRADMFGNPDPSFDPVAVVYNYGFSLEPDDESLLRHLLHNKEKSAEIFNAFKSLGTKIRKNCPVDFVLKQKATRAAA